MGTTGPAGRPGEERVRVNHEIRVRQVRVIDEEGQQLGIMAPRDAMREAEERGLDLVEVAPKASPPVCRIMDYGKYKYEQKRRARESRKHQHVVSVKEIKVRPKIDPHDLIHKAGHAREFLLEGHKVKLTVMFRGREMAHPEFGKELLIKMVAATKDVSTSDTVPEQCRLEGRNMSLVLSPIKVQAVATPKNSGDGAGSPPRESAEPARNSTKGITSNAEGKDQPGRDEALPEDQERLVQAQQAGQAPPDDREVAEASSPA